MSHISVRRQGWLPLPRPDPQLSLPFPGEDRTLPLAPTMAEWAAMETDVVDGVFRPPMKNERVIQDRRYPARSRNRHLHEERMPASLFSYDAASRTYKTTATRLRPRTWNALITVVDGDREVPFRLFQIVRRGDDWTRMRFRHLVAGEVLHELVVLNSEFDAAAVPEKPRDGITVVRDGDYWVARFTWSEANVEKVRRAGFRFSPIHRWWYTTDDRVAARLDKTLLVPTSASRPAKRRPLIRTWRR